MSPGLRKLALTAHVVSSVGWLGAVAAFLALALAGLASGDAPLVRGSYVAMKSLVWSVIVPLNLASLVTGLVSSLGTTWGLIRHYWVVAKLLLTVVGTILLLLHTQPIDHMARVAAETTLGSDLLGVRIQLAADAGAALLLLLVTTALGVYKPRGLTRYGRRKEQSEGTGGETERRSDIATPRWAKRLGMIVVAALLVFNGLKHGCLGGHALPGESSRPHGRTE